MSVENVTRAVVSRCKPYAAPETHNRVEHGADRVGEWKSVDDRHRRADAATVAEKPGAVGLILQLADGFSFGNDYVRRPDLGLAVRSWPARGEQGAEFGDKFRLHKQIGKSRVGRIGCGWRQDDFGVRVSARSPGFVFAEIRDRYPAYFGVVLRRDDDFERGPNRAIAPPDLYVVLGKSHFIAIGLNSARLICSRPDLAAVTCRAGKNTFPRRHVCGPRANV